MGPRRAWMVGWVLVLIAALPGSEAGGHSQGRVIGAFTDSGVRVLLRWVGPAEPAEPALRADLSDASRAARRGSLLVTFTPLSQGFHLYALNLPAEGIDGIGRPIRVEVGGFLTATGSPATANSVIRQPIAGATELMPVYSADPVTVWLPVVMGVTSADSGEYIARVWLSYAACSGRLCLAPVTRHLVEVHLTASEAS